MAVNEGDHAVGVVEKVVDLDGESDQEEFGEAAFAGLGRSGHWETHCVVRVVAPPNEAVAEDHHVADDAQILEGVGHLDAVQVHFLGDQVPLMVDQGVV